MKEMKKNPNLILRTTKAKYNKIFHDLQMYDEN